MPKCIVMNNLNVKDKLIGNSVYLMLDLIVLTLSGFVFWLIIAKTAPPEVYGIVATAISSMIILSSVSMFGFQIAAPKLISEYLQKKQAEKAKGVVAIAMRVVITLSFAIFVLVFAFSGQVATLTNLPVPVVMLIALSVFVWSFWSITNFLLQGYQRMKKIFVSDLVGSSLKIILTAAFIFLGMSYFGPLAGVLLGLIAVVLLRRSVLHIRLRPGVSSKYVILGYAWPAFLAGLTWIFFSNTPNIIINSIQGPFATGLFAVALTIVSPLSTIPTTFSQALFPITSGLSALKNVHAKQSRLINLVVRYSAFISIPALMFLLIFPKTFILIFSTEAYLNAQLLVPILGAATFMIGIGSIFNSTLYAIKKPKTGRNIAFATAVSFISLGIPLTFLFSSFGTAVAYASSIFILTFFSYLYTKKYIGFRLDYKPIFKIIVASLVLASILYFVDMLPSIPIKIVISLAALLVYFLTLIPLGHYSNDDLKIIEFLGRRVPVILPVTRRLHLFLSKYAKER